MRLFDLAVALTGVIILLLILPVIALLIKFESRGPVFYGCDRVGKKGRIFRMYKFRTMYETAVPVGGSVSPLGDPRVTSVGSFLRRTKINEFPQFLNVLKGDMSIVGPRPEAPDLAASYPPEAFRIFSVRPGLLGPNQITGRNEEESYPPGVNPVDYYIKEILPQKLPLDLKYVQEKSLLTDLKYLFQGAWVTVTGAVARRHLADHRTQIFMLVSDSALCLASFSLAYLLRFETLPFCSLDKNMLWMYLFAVLARIPFLVYFGCYQTLIRFIGLHDLKNVFLALALGSAGFIISAYMLGISMVNYGRIVFLLDWSILIVLTIGYRIALRVLRRMRHQDKPESLEVRRALIWGAGEEGYWCLRFLQENNSLYEVVGFIDEDPKIRNRRLEGLKVLGDHHHLEALAQLYKVQCLFLSKPPVSSKKLKHIDEICSRLRIEAKCFVPRSTTDIKEYNEYCNF